MKIDTQGMSLSLDSNYKETKSVDEQREEISKAIIQPTRLFTPEYVKEMKILINEVLDERDGKRGISYFDTEHFKHYVGEDEPPYEKWV